MEHSTLCVVLSQDSINSDEISLFEAMLRWSEKECERRGLETSPDRKRFCLGDALFLIRYLTLTAAQFASGPAKSGLLTQQESFAVLMNISSPGSWDLPDYMSTEAEERRLPREMLPSADVDLSAKYFCTRAMMQEPHCLNTSILDCSVTFTVDRVSFFSYRAKYFPGPIGDQVVEAFDDDSKVRSSNPGVSRKVPTRKVLTRKVISGKVLKILNIKISAQSWS